MKKLRVFVCFLIAFLLCFTVIPVDRARAEENVFVGGFPIGIQIDVGGLLIESVTGVETEYGTAYVEGIQKGDIIKKIGGVALTSADDMQNALSSEPMDMEIVRNGEVITVRVQPIIEVYTNRPRLGIKIKDKIYGIGTVTLVRTDGRYAALGHEIYDGQNDLHIPFVSGSIHDCKILGIKHGKRGEAGALLASIVSDSERGTVTCNNTFGIAGTYTAEIPQKELVQIADRSEVTPGAAKIKTTVSGNPEYFDIEIIKASKQSGKREKSIVFRVTDERLLKATGGVVRGMSGSPIIQNGKLVGAVTHVFLNDFTKGYGVYADCLN